MSSNITMLSYEEAEVNLQEKIIAMLPKSEIIRVWTPKDRIYTEDELCKLYTVYNIFVNISQDKKGTVKINPFEDVSFGINFKDVHFHSGLMPSVENKLRSWGKSSADAIANFFFHRNELFTGKVRFDLLTSTKADFILPNINFSTNVYLYRTIVAAKMSHRKDDFDEDPDRILRSYIEDWQEDMLFEQEHTAAVRKANGIDDDTT